MKYGGTVSDEGTGSKCREASNDSSSGYARKTENEKTEGFQMQQTLSGLRESNFDWLKDIFNEKP